MSATDPREEPLPPDASPAAVTRRAMAWGTLGLVLAAAAAARLTGPSAGAEDDPSRIAVQLVSLPVAQAVGALGNAAPETIAALRDRRLHLVRAPFFGIGGAIGAPITITCGAVSRTIVLTAAPIPVLVPIDRLGSILVTTTAPMGADARLGLVTADAPVTLPPVRPDRSLTLDVIVQ